MGLMLVTLAPALFILFWSSGFIVARAVSAHADAQFFLMCRFAAAALLWGIAARTADTRWPTPYRAGQHLAAGAAMMGIYLCLSFWAIARGLPAGIMALIGALQPLFTAAAMMARGTQAPSASTWWGLLLGLLGVVLVLLPRIEGSDSTITYAASGAGLLAVVALTIGTLAQRRLAAEDLRIAGCIQNMGATVVALFAVGVVGAVRFDGSLMLWGLLAWSVLITSVVGQGLLIWMMRRAGAAKVTALMLLVPPVAALLAFLIFQETLTPLQLVGFVLALAGVILARRTAR